MSYLNLLEILTLENISKFKLALFIHKIKNDPTNIPAIFSGTLKLASEVHRYNTRFATNFNIYRPSINNNNYYYGATTFSFVASKIWESIPSELKKTFLEPFLYAIQKVSFKHSICLLNVKSAHSLLIFFIIK